MRRYVVFWNVSLQLNPVGFYQLTKICIAPAVIAIEAVAFKKLPTKTELAAIAVLCLGVMLATVTDSQVGLPCLPGKRFQPARQKILTVFHAERGYNIS